MIRLHSGIYRIINLKNGKCYIGSALKLSRRRTAHFNLLKANKHPNAHLQNAYDSYGKENLIFEIIEFCPKEKLIQSEQSWIDIYKMQGAEIYNICPVAGSMFGRIVSQETKAKLRLVNLGKKHSEESKEKMKGRPSVWLGRKLAEETRKKMSIARKGQKRSEETKAKMRGRKCSDETKAKLSLSKMGKNNPMYGKHHSEERKREISEISKGNKYTLGYKHSEEAKKKIGEASKGNKYALGYKHSEEAKKRISEAMFIIRARAINKLKVA